MSLPATVIDRLFSRLAATYGSAWDRSIGQAPIADVKTAWAHELSGFASRLQDVAWALENLPERCPNVIEFRNLCRKAPAPEVPRLPEPKADPSRVAAELAKLGQIKAAAPSKRVIDASWAHSILAAHRSGIYKSPTVLRMAQEVAARYPSHREAA